MNFDRKMEHTQDELVEMQRKRKYISFIKIDFRLGDKFQPPHSEPAKRIQLVCGIHKVEGHLWRKWPATGLTHVCYLRF